MTIVLLEALVFGLNRLCDAAMSMGADLVLLTRDRGIYNYELEAGAKDRLRIIDVETNDRNEVLAAVRRLGAVDALVNQTDTWALVAADVAAELGLAHTSRDALGLTRSKDRLRTRLWEAGLSPHPGLAIEAGATPSVGDFGSATWPSIVKEASGTGSRNVVLAETPADAVTRIASLRAGGVDVALTLEPFFAGTLFSAETLTWHGETRLLAVSGRLLGGEWRFREEAVVSPVRLPAVLTDNIRDYVGRVLDAIGYDRGFSHTEFVMTKAGFETVEVNPRLGGSLLGEILSRSFGYNVYRAHLDLALDRRPKLLDTPLEPTAGLAQIFMYASAKGVFRGVSGVEGLTALPGSPQFFETMVRGRRIDHLGDHRGRVGVFLATAQTSELALYHAAAATAALGVHVEAS